MHKKVVTLLQKRAKNDEKRIFKVDKIHLKAKSPTNSKSRAHQKSGKCSHRDQTTPKESGKRLNELGYTRNYGRTVDEKSLPENK
jgi:hypothetical protein